MGFEADEIKFTEIKENCLGSLKGGSPSIPKRRRGYYRALKRGETWAKLQKAWRDSFNKVSTNIFYDSPFLKLLDDAPK